MQRFSRARQVFFFEEHIPTDHHLAYFEIHPFDGTTVKAIRPRIPHSWHQEKREQALCNMLGELISLLGGRLPVLWFYTPMMFVFARNVSAAAVVYDCMDELANFKHAPANLKQIEEELLDRADVVFTGGLSLYEEKRHRHQNIHPFPSSVDETHFRIARERVAEPFDQAGIPRPRLGYYGVIDERLDLELIGFMAAQRPELSFVLLGPVAKISPDDLPRAANIFYLGQKSYHDLPAYLSGWDVALMPFALNDATRFISPTKTPEYLAAGRPVVSTKVADVVRGYKDIPGVFIADTADHFCDFFDDALHLAKSADAWIGPVDRMLAQQSWDLTFQSMSALLDEVVLRNAASPSVPHTPHVLRGREIGREPYDYLIVGAGFAGSVLAERLANDGKRKVLVCDKRSHIGGNAFDHFNEHGVLVHKYGPHIFHTNSEEVAEYLSRFTAWRPYEHRVLAQIGELRVPIPINRTTLNMLYNIDLPNEAAAALFLAARAEPCDPILTSKDVVVSQVGSELYQTFFEGYTRKQWGLDPSELDRSVTGRIPTRTTIDDRYFLDTFQAMPVDGYTRMFERMLDSENIALLLGTDFAELKQAGLAKHIVFTGPIDEYFAYQFGQLPYRSLRFHHETHDTQWLLPVAVINYPSEDVAHTRLTEYKHLTGQVHNKTSISYEYACADGDPFYPIPRPENHALYKQYEALARQQRNVTFAGRLGSYKYFNMDQVIGQSLATYRRLKKRHDAGSVLADLHRD